MIWAARKRNEPATVPAEAKLPHWEVRIKRPLSVVPKTGSACQTDASRDPFTKTASPASPAPPAPQLMPNMDSTDPYRVFGFFIPPETVLWKAV